MKSEIHLGDDAVRELFSRARDLGLLPQRAPDGLYNVKSAAEYLDTSAAALRGLIKRCQIECNRSTTGRITFTREQLDAHAAGGSTDADR